MFVGSIVIIVFSVLIVAVKDRSVPLASVSFRVIKLPTFESVISESSKFLTASLNVNVISVITASILTVGGRESPTVNIAKEFVIALS